MRPRRHPFLRLIWRQRPQPVGFAIAYKLDGDMLECHATW